MAELRLEPITGTIPGVRDNKVYNDADSKDCESYIIYVSNLEGEKYAYKDQACTQKASLEEMRDMFLKGVIVCTGENDNTIIRYFKPSVLNVFAGDGYVPYASLYCDMTVYSAEYVPEVNE